MHTHTHTHLQHTHTTLTHAHTCTRTHTHTHTHTHRQNELIEPFLGGLRTPPFPALGTDSILTVVPVGIDTGQVSDSDRVGIS